jgi:hypothetical protein
VPALDEYLKANGPLICLFNNRRKSSSSLISEPQKALGLTIPLPLLGHADEAIE